ncbi:hypothetical protein B7486_64415, partial [cyanobacterium TDX16]
SHNLPAWPATTWSRRRGRVYHEPSPGSTSQDGPGRLGSPSHHPAAAAAVGDVGPAPTTDPPGGAGRRARGWDRGGARSYSDARTAPRRRPHRSPGADTGCQGPDQEGLVTEVPEHLLRRSQERRAAMGLGPEPGDAGGGDAPAASDAASSAPAAAAAPEAPAGSAPLPVPPKPADAPPPPKPPFVEAAERRKRVPMWALPVLAALPVWAFLYAGTLDPKTSAASDPVEAGAAIYSERCASCHGGSGGGGVGPALADGAVLETFADPAAQVEWVALGSEGFLEAGTYGDTG